MRTNVRKLSLTALFAVIALIIFIVEAQIPLPVNAPGLKLGLANIIILFMLFLGGMWKTQDIFMVFLVRVLLAALITGNAQALLFSFTGGLFALLVMLSMRTAFKGAAIPVVSVAGAIAHNAGQITVAALITSAGVFVYLPALVAGGIISGLLTGFAVYFIYKAHPKFISYIGGMNNDIR
ncbi:MAG: Gx transporter family protein [Oscillospiraceae bacterium]|jgi:heptaprenyl diphosphate synthase|nr:Gx transporter family protein [Oscillospiraceae bacterium]